MSFVGTWTNQLGSVLEITRIDVDKYGKESLTGTYETKVGTKDATGPDRIAGFVKGALIGFTTSYGAANSICCWVGRLGTDRDGRECISTLWQLVSAETCEVDSEDTVRRRAAGLWEAFSVQADVFYHATT